MFLALSYVKSDPKYDIGVANYSCDPVLMKKSKNRPTNVNSLRPADINVVMALGDSLTVNFGNFRRKWKTF